MSANETRGQHEADHWEKYERLPAAARRLLQLAHTNYQVGWIARNLKLLGQEQGLRASARTLWKQRREDILLHYGPTHPGLR